MKRKQPRFRVGQVVAIIGYESDDPRQFVCVIRQTDEAVYLCHLEIDGKVEATEYTEGALRHLTTREIGPRPARRKGKWK